MFTYVTQPAPLHAYSPLPNWSICPATCHPLQANLVNHTPTHLFEPAQANDYSPHPSPPLHTTKHLLLKGPKTHLSIHCNLPCHIPNLFTPTPLPHTYSFCPNPPRHTLIKLTPTHTSTCLPTSPNLPLHIFTSFTPTWPAIYLPALPPTCPAIYLYASPQPTLPHLYPPSPDLPQHRPIPNRYQLVTPHTYPSCPNWPHIPNDLTQTHLETCLPWYPKLPCHTLMHFLTSCPTTLLSTLPQAATPQTIHLVSIHPTTCLIALPLTQSTYTYIFFPPCNKDTPAISSHPKTPLCLAQS